AGSFAEYIALALANLKLREELREQALRDPLTGLYNRRYMEECLDRELHRAHRKQSPIGVIMLDLDHFKAFNDNHGHAVGDAVLRAVGTFLANQIRGGDIACRYGGEEFLLILPEANLHSTVNRAQELLQAARTMPALHRGQSLRG